mgnify:CR=1 FL=1
MMRSLAVFGVGLLLLAGSPSINAQDAVAIWRGAKSSAPPPKSADPKANPPATGTPTGVPTGQPVTGTQDPGQVRDLSQARVIYSGTESPGEIANQLSLQVTGEFPGFSLLVDTSFDKELVVSLAVDNEPILSAIKKLALAAGGADVIQVDSMTYLLTLLKKDSPLFHQYAETALYRTKNERAEDVHGLLSKQVQEYVSVRPLVNMLAVTAPKALLDTIMKQIVQLDTPARQLVVEALVTELDATSGLETGFSWSWKNFAVDNNLNVQYSKATFQDVANMKALVSNQKAKLRANPRLAAFEGRESEFFVGQETYYSIITGNVNFPTAQIQKVDSGVRIKFTALVGDDGWVTLTIEPEVSDSIAADNGNPTLNIRRAKTHVRVRSGETIAIGGLLQETESRRKVSIPILGQIPIIGELFSQRIETKRKTETVILITPMVEPLRVGK